MARRSKRSSNRAKRLIDQDSRPKIVPLKLDAKALSRMVAGRGTILPNLPNMQDNLVIQKLATASIGSLPLDHFGHLLCKEICSARRHSTKNSENSKANRIETMKGPAESGQICSVGRRKVAKKIAKNKRCYANTLRPRSRMLLKAMKGGSFFFSILLALLFSLEPT